MSLLYECINGIIQGGILGDGEDFAASEEIASLCVSKLRGMIMMNSDANCEFGNSGIWKTRLTLAISLSKIRGITSLQQDRRHTSLSRRTARRRDHGVY